MKIWTDDRGLKHQADVYTDVSVRVGVSHERGLVVHCVPTSMLINFDESKLSEGLPNCIACAAR